MRKIRKIVVHCSDSPDSLDIGFKEINGWHKQNGWLSPSGISCGYHYIIRRDGRVQRGRPDSETGAHVRNHNSDSIGICWIGRKDMTTEQYDSLRVLINGLRQTYNLDIDKVFGHTELDSGKTCPNVNMNVIRAELAFTNMNQNAHVTRWKRIKEQACID